MFIIIHYCCLHDDDLDRGSLDGQRRAGFSISYAVTRLWVEIGKGLKDGAS